MGHLTEVMRGIRTDWWTFYILGLLGTFLGMAIACLAGTLQHALPALPSRLTLAAGFAVLAIFLLSMGLVPGLDSETMKSAFIAAFAVCLVLFNAGLFLLGLTCGPGAQSQSTILSLLPSFDSSAPRLRTTHIKGEGIHRLPLLFAPTPFAHASLGHPANAPPCHMR